MGSLPVAPSKRGSTWLQPGNTVAQSGIYQVRHYAHRLPHSVTMTAGDVLPPCSVCGAKVSYVLLAAREALSEDADFADPALSAAEADPAELDGFRAVYESAQCKALARVLLTKCRELKEKSIKLRTKANSLRSRQKPAA